MNIRRAVSGDIDEIMSLYSMAREFMKATGNPDQWKDNYPSRELIMSDVKSGSLYVGTENGEILASFFFVIGLDPTYGNIYGGRWLDDNDEYGTIHRVAVKVHGKGVADEIYRFCSGLNRSIRIDTHKDNKPMQRSLEKNGFKKCGIIYLENGDERIAYQRIQEDAKIY